MKRIQTAMAVCLLAVSLSLTSGCKGTSSLTSPTEAYKSLYAAVKRKDPAGIKKVLSQATIEFMTAAAQMQKKPFDEAIANGLSESTFSPTLPELCKERVKDNMGGLEVKRTDGQWEDLPFILENGEWKLAVGDLFKGTYVKPGEPLCMKPQQFPTGPPANPSGGPATPGTTGPTAPPVNPVPANPAGKNPADVAPSADPAAPKDAPAKPPTGPVKKP